MKDSVQFIGRDKEFARLKTALRTKTASLIVLKGRRRVGKSRLVLEFAKDMPYLRFVGLAPNDKITAQIQRDHFAQLLTQQTGLPEFKTDDWSKLFTLLNERIQTGRQVVIFDEITWMGSKDPTFLSKLQSAWENEFRNNPELIFIICGAVSSWIEKNILSSTGYYGRISIKMTLDELPLPYCNQLMKLLGFKGSLHERLLLLAVTGGIPWYLEQIDPGLSAIENIKQLCFTQDGLLVDEYRQIFHDLFPKKRREIMHKIVNRLAEGPADYQQIANDIDYPSGGALTQYLKELVISGFIAADSAWQLTSGKTNNTLRYRLRDNYLRFYLKYIQPRLEQIERQHFMDITLTALPGFETVMGLQVENLILNNRQLIHKLLSIDPNHIVNDNPYFQNKTTKQQACQVDYLIQTKFKTLYVCEIKFSLNPIGKEIIKEIQAKIDKLNCPKSYTAVPVLIVANGVSPQLEATDYFFKFISMEELLTV